MQFRPLSMTALVLLLSIAGPALLAACCGGQPKRAKPPGRKGSASARLPRVLLIGDSISMGYTVPVQARLKGTAEVHGWPIAVNPTTHALAKIDGHLSKMRWDVIHFNWGLNDLEHSGIGRPRIPLELYEKNLRQLVNRIEKTGAVLIWATTTPVPEGTRSRTAGDAVKYNAVAADVMQGRNILFNDLYAFALPRLATMQDKANVHFNDAGSALLAEEVTRHVRIALAQVPRRLKNDPLRPSDPRRIHIGLQKQLLVDDYVIAEKQNVTRELGKVKKIGVVMEPSLPTDFHPTEQFADGKPKTHYDGFGYRTTVLWNEHDAKFQMLYRASAENLTAYAESKDGIHWTRPLVSQDGKSNLITHRGRSRGTFYEASFTIDPTVPWGHPEKYKAAFNPGNVMCAIAHSADGIHWKSYNDGKSATGRAADAHNQILWDPIAGRYMLLTRTDMGAAGGRTEDRAARIMAHSKGNNLRAHPEAWKTLATVCVDDPAGKKTPAGVMALQMESMNIWVHEGVYFGLMHVLTMGDLTGSTGDETKVADPHKRPETDVIDFYIGTSRDGVNFDKSWIYARKPLIKRGGDGAFDKAVLHPASEIVTRGDEHWIYYSAMYSQHHAPDAAKLKSGKIGLAKLPLDRFICLAAKDEPGVIVTKPFTLEGDRLAVNVDAKGGWVQVELLDEVGEGIPGFSGEPAKRHKNIDELRLAPQWESRGDLSKLKGRIVRLRFTLRNAKLYAFAFAQP